MTANNLIIMDIINPRFKKQMRKTKTNLKVKEKLILVELISLVNSANNNGQNFFIFCFSNHLTFKVFENNCTKRFFKTSFKIGNKYIIRVSQKHK